MVGGLMRSVSLLANAGSSHIIHTYPHTFQGRLHHGGGSDEERLPAGVQAGGGDAGAEGAGVNSNMWSGGDRWINRRVCGGTTV